VLKSLLDAQFTRFGEDDWQALARATWKTVNGRLAADYDPALGKVLETIDLEKPLPPFWFLFAGLKGVPVLALRGANSDLLSATTLEAMAAAHPDLEAVTVPDQGHVPALRGRDMIQRLRRFIIGLEERPTARRSLSRMSAT
jgi:pimeloyl-ACP methyl ester carboxylesterase